MSQQDVVVDPLAFARDGRCLERGFPLTALPRVAAEALGKGGEFTVRIEGLRDKDGKSYLLLAVDGRVSLACQRCLEPMEWVCRVRSRLMLVPKGQPIPEDELEDDSYDAVEVEDRQDLLILAEDEVLLALPAAPRHDVCEAPSGADGASKESPFAGLAKLSGGKGSK
jgi:DUF177 domain-containing protein